MKTYTIAATLAFYISASAASAGNKTFSVVSPNKQIRVEIKVGKDITYSLTDNGTVLMRDNRIGLSMSEKGNMTENVRIASKNSGSVKENINTFLYRQSEVENKYNYLSINLQNGICLEMRAYDEGIAYRLSTTKYFSDVYTIDSETAEFNFTSDYTAWLPYSTNEKNQKAMAFQATYDVAPLSQSKNILAFLPATVDCKTAKLTIMESDLEAYPGMFLKADGTSLTGEFAKYPKSTDFYPWRQQEYVTSTEDYIARCKGNRTFPWRIIAVSHDDREMPVNNLVYSLSSPSRIGNTEWIKPGMVAWDWWNDWGLSGVGFKAGINMDTYRHYIDFAAQNGLEYIILDEGWYEPKSGNMLVTIPEINLPELVAYAKERNVGIILWTVFNVLDKDLEEACRKYSEMGIKGFKVDFLDRDDQQGVEMVYRIAETCAKHQLVLDLHGIYKPTGINRTYPNVINFEAVFGMEEAKWSKADEKDMPLYDVTFPFIRMQTGFVDFTPGGMRNASRKDFQPVYYNPMTMGTRCHQLAMYIVHDSPLTMLADTPTAYEKEKECTDFISSIPTVFEETIIPLGKMGEYIVTARKNNDSWYVGGQTNWDARDIELHLGFLPEHTQYEAVIFCDGTNADKAATDYKVIRQTVDSESHLSIHLASGGGFAIKLAKK
ncbi:MAG: glycoside hydrolase family 97 protein [Bacteroides sp.]|nr:glycoside hydrolase family 97 protein [Roseburia sp.]MCM1346939.1 glycoside hydrolase family 97 protein [Bacteroides sp.]MCM1421516.1 glycoside hydrolase family 97 protein [Bacteroides sp.]